MAKINTFIVSLYMRSILQPRRKIDILYNTKECVAVLTMLYKKNGAVICVRCGFVAFPKCRSRHVSGVSHHALE